MSAGSGGQARRAGVLSTPLHPLVHTSGEGQTQTLQPPRPKPNRRSEWVTLEEEEFAGFMMVVMPCRSDKSKNGVAK